MCKPPYPPNNGCETSSLEKRKVPGLARAVFTAGIAILALSLPGCKAPSVRLATEEPIKVDINMRVDIYQHTRDNNGAGATATGRPPAEKSTPESRRRNRIADIQEYKNSRIVGEGVDGLLVILEAPPGDYGQFVVRTIRDENADRMEVMRSVAERTRRPLPDVQADQAAEWRQRSFSGEWIQVPAEDGAPARWQQKAGAGS